MSIMTMNIINPQKEILIVKHRILNNSQLNFEQEIDKIYQELGHSVNGRQIVLCFEGDYMAPSWSNDVILVHGSYAPSMDKFQDLREQGVAAYLAEVLENVDKSDQRFYVCLEAKISTTAEATDKAVDSLKQAAVEKAYFDSFFGGKLNHVHQANQLQRTSYPTSLHLLAKIGGIDFAVSNGEHNVVTIPNAVAFFARGTPEKPIIYGAVGSKEKVKKIAEDPNALGAYWRGDESSSVKMLINSFGRGKNV